MKSDQPDSLISTVSSTVSVTQLRHWIKLSAVKVIFMAESKLCLCWDTLVNFKRPSVLQLDLMLFLLSFLFPAR